MPQQASSGPFLTALKKILALARKAPPLLVLSLALLATLLAWQVTRVENERKASTVFVLRTEQLATEINRRLLTYEQILRGAEGLFAVHDSVTRTVWRDYVALLRLNETMPGIQGLGFAKAVQPHERAAHISEVRAEGFPDYDIRPNGTRATYTSIVYLEPFSERNLRAFGYDMFSEPVRRAAMEQARDTASVRVSGKVKLVQEADDKPQAGFIMYAPVYRSGKAPATLEGRRNALIGYVYAPFRAEDFMQGLLDHPMREINLEIFDGETTDANSLLYNSDGKRDAGPNMDPAFTRTSVLNVNGSSWTLHFIAAREFKSMYGSVLANFVLGAGTLMSLLLFGMARGVTKRHAAAEARAEDMTRALSSSAARMGGIIHASMEAIVSVDENQHIVIFNPAAETMFRCKAEDTIGSPLSRFIPERFRDTHHRHVERFGITGTSDRQMGKQRDLYGLRANGEEFPIEASISQITENGRKLYTVMLRDITRRKQDEAALDESRLQLRELAASVQNAREEEKNHIARELHDDLGQSLTALKMDLSLLANKLPATDRFSADKIKSMRGLIDDTVTSVRRIASDLRPVMLDDLGLMPAIDWLTHDFSQRTGINVKLNIANHNIRLDKDAETALYRAIQEALTNVARHAKAMQITISMAHSNQGFTVKICDDGTGISVEDQRKRKSLGLLGMRERVQILGGQMNVSGAPGEGTAIEIILPVSVIQKTAENE